MSEAIHGERFSWHECAERLEELLEVFEALPSSGGWALVDEQGERAGIFRVPPLLSLIAPLVDDPLRWSQSLPDSLGRELVVLLQAGAAALGWFDEDALVRHKALKRYVVRGRGRAQPTHLKTRGKSRYGSRLRLQNHRALLEELAARVLSWREELGEPERLLYHAPKRTWPELLALAPRPLVPEGVPALRIPLDVRVPDFGELERVRFELTHGRITWASRAAAARFLL